MAHDTSTSIVELDDFTVRYGSFTAVDGASFRMPAGACGLLGVNGAGKTSILKAILGLIDPAGGRASVLGRDVTRYGPKLRDLVGYMPEKEAEFPGVSGLEAVTLAGRLSGLPARVALRRAHEVLYLVGLDEHRYRACAGYSAGMKQKVKLAIALVHDPKLLFLDEPTNGLDPAGRREILGLFGDLADMGKSLILSSHILPDVETVCRYVVLIDRGRVRAQGNVAELTQVRGRRFRLRVRGDAERYSAALEEHGLLRDRDEDGVFRVFLSDTDGPERLFALAESARVQLRLLEPERKTLQDVFLSAVRDGERV